MHWFNPLIWVMQKQAAVDVELSCDEQVIQDFGYAQRKAYTEALLSMLHKQSVKKIALSTNFYGGKQIMKKRFKNILINTGKKNGLAAFACAVVLAMGLGTLVGCSVTPGSPAAAPGPSGVNDRQAGNMQIDLPLRDTSDAVPVTAAFVPGMGCSDPACTDASHHHDCPADCADYEHYHTCALDCTEASHHHSTAASGTSGHHSGHHADAHH